MGLVDYEGSDSEDEDVVMEEKPKEDTVGDEFFGESSEKPLELDKNDVLEDIVKRKDWEIKIAEKQKRKLERKAAKKAAKKEAKKIAKISKSGIKKKVQIQAFGAPANDNSSDSDNDEEPVKQTSKSSTGFLSFLPAPKGKNNVLTTTISTKSLIPPSVAKKAAPVNIAPSTVPAPKFVDSDDDEEDDTVGGSDFFGFSTNGKQKTQEYYEHIPTSSNALDVVGPSKPSRDEYVHPSQMYNMVDAEEDQQEPQLKRGKITDEQAHKLLMRFSHDIGPEEKRSIDEMANSIVDVNVDDAIGPDVKSTILKNLSHRAFADATSAPLPQAPPGGQVARRRNQITYLANMAVSREEALKEQWANQKQSKRMARQKYGF